MDGTLLDRDGRIHPRDVRAVEMARSRGAIVTIATGRLTAGTHWVGRELGLTAPLVCADGGVIACAETERILDRSPLALGDSERILDRIATGDLASFVFTCDAIHSCEKGRDHHPYIRGWSPRITTHRDVVSAPAWRSDTAVMILGIGPEGAVRDVETWISEAHPAVEAVSFTFGPASVSVVRVVVRGVSKASGLAKVAERLGIAREDVAVIGDWLNDVSMFEWAGRSYAMPHAPDRVKKAATHPLEADACKHGAIAQAIEHWLSDS